MNDSDKNQESLFEQDMNEKGQTQQQIVGFVLLVSGVYVLSVFFGVIVPFETYTKFLATSGLVNVPILQLLFSAVLVYSGVDLLQRG
ncbi:MAG: hypothetical protein V1777_01810 [Candidatus Micrarchaeota archaeon]